MSLLSDEGILFFCCMREIWFFFALRDEKKNCSSFLSVVFVVCFCSQKKTLEFLSFFLDFASFFTHKSHTRLIVIVINNSSSSIQER